MEPASIRRQRGCTMSRSSGHDEGVGRGGDGPRRSGPAEESGPAQGRPRARGSDSEGIRRMTFIPRADGHATKDEPENNHRDSRRERAAPAKRPYAEPIRTASQFAMPLDTRKAW